MELRIGESKIEEWFPDIYEEEVDGKKMLFA